MTKKARPLPGEEYETERPLPPVEDVVNELEPADPLIAAEPESAPTANTVEPPPLEETPPEPVNQL